MYVREDRKLGAKQLAQTLLVTYSETMTELVFEVAQEADGGFIAEALGESIFTQAETWEELRANVQEAVEAFYFDGKKPHHVRLHLVRDEVLAIA